MAIKQTFQAAVKEQLAKSNGTKWGSDESVAIILALIIDNTGEPGIADDKEFVGAIKEVVNPSQFAQKLENADDPDNKGQKLLKRAGRGERVKNALLDFGK